jgi:hypothetical protein
VTYLRQYRERHTCCQRRLLKRTAGGPAGHVTRAGPRASPRVSLPLWLTRDPGHGKT